MGGGSLPWLVKLTNRRMQLVMSFVGGLMLGVALLHLLPHSVAEQGSLDQAALWTLGGLLFMFLLIRVFHVHAHEHGEGAGHDHAHDHSHCGHDHPHEHHSPTQAASPYAPPLMQIGTAGPAEEPAAAGHSFSWLGLAFGLALHTIIDGLALGAAVAAESHAEPGWGFFGVGTFLAVVLHKPLDALSITSLMASGGWSKRSAFYANLAFATMCPIGAVGFVLGLDRFAAAQGTIIGCALAFAAGVFLCISLADLLPEVTFHSHDRLRLTLALFLGVALAWAIGFLEPKHSHDPNAHQHGILGHGH